MIVALLRVEESRQPGAHRPDWLGAITFSGALAALVYALIQGNGKGWGSTEIEACLAGSAALLVIFLVVERVQRAPMFDLSLFCKPTFAGGSIVAFVLSAGMFAMLLYLVLYLQDVLGYSALDTGLRLLVLSGGILLTSTIAGRLTTRVPINLLIGPGLVLVGVGLILMRGLTAASGWEHLIPGFIVAGAGVGVINPPLASTAVGVVEPARAGMASGINSTFRQVGIATGIAGLGAIFSHTVSTKVFSQLSALLGTAQAHTFAAGVAQGTGAGAAIASAPPVARATAAHAVRVGFVDGLNEIFLIGAILSLVAAGLAFVLIRSRDFEASAAYGSGVRPVPGPPPAEAALPEAAAVPAVAAVAADEPRSQTAVHRADESVPRAARERSDTAGPGPVSVAAGPDSGARFQPTAEYAAAAPPATAPAGDRPARARRRPGARRPGRPGHLRGPVRRSRRRARGTGADRSTSGRGRRQPGLGDRGRGAGVRRLAAGRKRRALLRGRPRRRAGGRRRRQPHRADRRPRAGRRGGVRRPGSRPGSGRPPGRRTPGPPERPRGRAAAPGHRPARAHPGDRRAPRGRRLPHPAGRAAGARRRHDPPRALRADRRTRRPGRRGEPERAAPGRRGPGGEQRRAAGADRRLAPSGVTWPMRLPRA